MFFYVPLARNAGLLKDSLYARRKRIDVDSDSARAIGFSSSQLDLVYTSEHLDLTKKKTEENHYRLLDVLKETPYVKICARKLTYRDQEQ